MAWCPLACVRMVPVRGARIICFPEMAPPEVNVKLNTHARVRGERCPPPLRAEGHCTPASKPVWLAPPWRSVLTFHAAGWMEPGPPTCQVLNPLGK